MASAMNFKPADIAAKAAAVERRANKYDPPTGGLYERRAGGDYNDVRDDILKEMQEKNAKARSAVRPGQKYTATSIVEGKGMTPTDFGFGLKGAAIPWQTEEIEKPFIERPKPPKFPQPTGNNNPIPPPEGSTPLKFGVAQSRPTSGRNDAIQRRLGR